MTFGNSVPGNDNRMHELGFISEEIENCFDCFPIRIPSIFVIFESSFIDLQFNRCLLECAGITCLGPHPSAGGFLSGTEIGSLGAKHSCHRSRDFNFVQAMCHGKRSPGQQGMSFKISELRNNDALISVAVGG